MKMTNQTNRTNQKTIVFTGGGSAGHVSVNVALIPYFLEQKWNVYYIGSKEGIEKEIITESFPTVHYQPISSGKLRRYFSWKNFSDPLRVLKGTLESSKWLKKWNPDIIFSKGGFVSVPVVMAAKRKKIPVAIHESDVTPGLANKLAVPFATKIFTTFPETVEYLAKPNALYVGAIIREDLFSGNAKKGRERCGFDEHKPVLMIMGGSLGAQKINEIIRLNLGALTDEFQIVHLCGKGNVDSTIQVKEYRQFEYVTDELADLLAATDLVLTRAGSNSIFEFLALKIPMLLIPLSRQASRGDQIVNARSFEKQGFAKVLEEENLTKESLYEAIIQLRNEETIIQDHMKKGHESFTISDMYKELVSMMKNEKKIK
jgi:UDP-N-acetylglucosamine--N-acetylmuramyl-(pentapeptide) pyrophosphoryl-undecaprenol N-acetylglucosamine transferase